jgi:hypothetical protein
MVLPFLLALVPFEIKYRLTKLMGDALDMSWFACRAKGWICHFCCGFHSYNK